MELYKTFSCKQRLSSSKIVLREENKIIIDTKEIVQVLNDHYINIVERPCVEKSDSGANQSQLTGDK